MQKVQFLLTLSIYSQVSLNLSVFFSKMMINRDQTMHNLSLFSIFHCILPYLFANILFKFCSMGSVFAINDDWNNEATIWPICKWIFMIKANTLPVSNLQYSVSFDINLIKMIPNGIRQTEYCSYLVVDTAPDLAPLSNFDCLHLSNISFPVYFCE